MFAAAALVVSALAAPALASTGMVHFANSSSTAGPTGSAIASHTGPHPHPTAPATKWNATAPAHPRNGTTIVVGPGQVTSTIYTTTTVCPATTWHSGKPTTYTTTSTVVKTSCPRCTAKPTASPPAAPSPSTSPSAQRPASGPPQPAASCPVCPVCPNGGGGAAAARTATVTVTVTAPAAGAPAPSGARTGGGMGGGNVPPPPPGDKPTGPWMAHNGSHPHPTASGRPHGSGHIIRPTGASSRSRPSVGTSSFLTLSTHAA